MTVKSVLAILCGHHGIGTGASFEGRDEWSLAREDALELYLQLDRDGIVWPALEPIAEDNSPAEAHPRERSILWALKQKPAAVIELHYNSMPTPKFSGHLIASSKMTPFVEAMAEALDALPNGRRATIIDIGLEIPRELDPIPCCLLEPAFIFEEIVGTPEWRPMLVAAIKKGIYDYFKVG